MTNILEIASAKAHVIQSYDKLACSSDPFLRLDVLRDALPIRFDRETVDAALVTLAQDGAIGFSRYGHPVFAARVGIASIRYADEEKHAIYLRK